MIENFLFFDSNSLVSLAANHRILRTSFVCDHCRGTYSVLRRCIHRESRRQLAVKIVDLKRLLSTGAPSVAGYYLVFKGLKKALYLLPTSLIWHGLVVGSTCYYDSFCC